MAGLMPLFLKSDALQRSQPNKVALMYVITGAKAGRFVALTFPPALVGYDAASLTTAIINAFMLSQQDPAPAGDIPGDTCFDSTSLGTDAIGFVLSMQGQAKQAVAMKATVQLGTSAPVEILQEASQSALTSSLSTAVAASASGNMYGRIVSTGLDAATSGYVLIELLFSAK